MYAHTHIDIHVRNIFLIKTRQTDGWTDGWMDRQMLTSNYVQESSCLCRLFTRKELMYCIYMNIFQVCVCECVGGRDVSRRLKKHLHPPVGLFCMSHNHIQTGMWRAGNRAVLQHNMTLWHQRLVCVRPHQTQRSSVPKTSRFHPRTDP